MKDNMISQLKVLEESASVSLLNFTNIVNSPVESTLEGKIRQYKAIRQAEDMVDQLNKKLSEIKQNWQYGVLPDALREAGVKTITVDGVGRVSMSSRWSASMLDKSKGMQWLRDNGHPDIIQETVNASTLAAFAKNLMETEGIELPDDTFKVGIQTGVSLTAV